MMSTHHVVDPLLIARKAVRTIESMWCTLVARGRTTRQLIRSFLWPEVSTFTFDQLVAYFEREDVVSACSKVLWRLSRGRETDARILLAAFIIANHPTCVFERAGEHEQRLFRAAGVVTRQFESVPTRAALLVFFERYRAWEAADAQRVSDRTEEALLALYRADMDLPANDPRVAALKAELKAAIERLERRGGPAKLARHRLLVTLMAACARVVLAHGKDICNALSAMV